MRLHLGVSHFVWAVEMKKIITLCVLLILSASQVAVNAADISNQSSSLGLDGDSSVELMGEYDLGHSLKSRYQLSDSKYDFLNESNENSTPKIAWIGVAGDFGEVRAGFHDSLDTIATIDANQHKVEGAYDLIMRSDESVKQSITYKQQSGSIGMAAQYGTGSLDNESMGVSLNAQKGSYEAAIAYQRNPDSQGSLKGRVTYKSRNNSKVRLDLVAEKFDAGDSPVDEIKASSVSFMVGAKYKLTTKAYVVGQYGVVGFGDNGLDINGEDPTLGRDFNALSLEAGYSLSDSTSVFISHSQKNYDTSSLAAPLFGRDEASQTNSIGVRLNW